MVVTPMTYFAAHELGTGCSVMVTGSHNPPDYNGLKMVVAGGTLAGDDIQALRERIDAGRLATGTGHYRVHDVGGACSTGSRDVKSRADDRGRLRQRRAGLAPTLFRRLGCVRRALLRRGRPVPEPPPGPVAAENLADLTGASAGDCEIGLAFDGDGDRLGVVTKDGHMIYPDRQLMLFAADVLSRVPGATVIYDVKSTRNLGPWIAKHGGKPLLWRTGHSFIKAKMKETRAALAGEMSGHTFFGERWYGFDDGLYAAARLLEILSRHADPSAVLDALPTPGRRRVAPCAEASSTRSSNLQHSASFRARPT
jgi:phosphomannomutase/phosphoglucomutase